MTLDKAVGKLRRWQPAAISIRRTVCDVCRGLMLSYTLPEDNTEAQRKQTRKEGREACGYWCSECGFSNGGTRELW